MPSSITLTVTYLPTSTSFFLSALQPLGYIYRGRSGDTIGFGPSSSTSPPDFWITQECPGVPAGAAHVAFPASSHTAVQEFFKKAINAGGKMYGDPAVRDRFGYYSAAVIDFDGNSIEAVYRPDLNDSDKENKGDNNNRSLVVAKKTHALRGSSMQVVKMPSHAPPTTVSRKPESSPPTGDALDRILNEARNTANVARDAIDRARPNLTSSHSSPNGPQNTNSNGNGNGSNDAIFGALLGAAAGAAMTFAFSNRNSNSPTRSADNESKRGSRRPSLSGRSNTAPAAEHGYSSRPSTHSPSAVSPSTSRSRAGDGGRGRDGGGGGRYITLNDNEYVSTIRQGPGSATQRPRRGSVDSGVGMSPLSSTSTSRNTKSRGMKTKKLETSPLPPPSSYRGPSGAEHLKGRSPSHSRPSSRQSHADSGSGLGSRSGSRRRASLGSIGNSLAKEDEDDSMKTILHIRERVRRVDTFPTSPDNTSKSKSGSKKSDSHSTQTSSNTTKYSSTSKSTAKPDHYPLPPSRAATWAHGGSDASFSTARPSRSVVGKVRDMKRLDVSRSEIGPEDSVSQVSTRLGGRR